jgi:SH3-like domain-containing protein
LDNRRRHESASPTARIVARLSYGTRVSVTGRMGDWYQIEHLGKSVGWVHRQVIGM